MCNSNIRTSPLIYVPTFYSILVKSDSENDRSICNIPAGHSSNDCHNQWILLSQSVLIGFIATVSGNESACIHVIITQAVIHMHYMVVHSDSDRSIVSFVLFVVFVSMSLHQYSISCHSRCIEWLWNRTTYPPSNQRIHSFLFLSFSFQWLSYSIFCYLPQTTELSVWCEWRILVPMSILPSYYQPHNVQFAKISILCKTELNWLCLESLILEFLFCSLHPAILFWLSHIIGITGETNGTLRNWFGRGQKLCRSSFLLFISFLRRC